MSVEPKLPREDPPATLELNDVYKHNWKTPTSRDALGHHLEVGENLLEYILHPATLDDDHPRAGYVRDVPSEEVFDFIAEAHADGLGVEKIADGSQTTVAVGETASVAEDLSVAVQDHDRETIQQIFGHPECAREHRVEWHENDVDDPLYETAANSPSAERVDDDPETIRVSDPHHILNQIWAYLGWQFVEFHPCSFECDEAFGIAKRNGELLREEGYGDEAEALFKYLAAPASWSGYHGLAHVKSGHAIGEYVTDDRWDERKVIWVEEHDAKASC